MAISWRVQPVNNRQNPFKSLSLSLSLLPSLSLSLSSSIACLFCFLFFSCWNRETVSVKDNENDKNFVITLPGGDVINGQTGGGRQRSCPFRSPPPPLNPTRRLRVILPPYVAFEVLGRNKGRRNPVRSNVVTLVRTYRETASWDKAVVSWWHHMVIFFSHQSLRMRLERDWITVYKDEIKLFLIYNVMKAITFLMAAIIS